MYLMWIWISKVYNKRNNFDFFSTINNKNRWILIILMMISILINSLLSFFLVNFYIFLKFFIFSLIDMSRKNNNIKNKNKIRERE